MASGYANTTVKAKTLGSLNVGDTIEISVKAEHQSFLGKTLVWRVADKNRPGYPGNSVTLITDKVICAFAFDAKESYTSNTSRKNFGNNRYSYSNLLQWANSTAGPGAWFSYKYGQDMPPNSTTVVGYNPYSDKAGFLSMLPYSFVSVLMDTSTPVLLNSTLDGSASETITTKMFFASRGDVDGTISVESSSRLALFATAPAAIAYPTEELVQNTSSPNASISVSTGYRWWLRTPSTTTGSSGSSTFIVASEGSTSTDSCYYDYATGFRPLCNQSSALAISEAKNSNGHFELKYAEFANSDGHIGTFGNIPPSFVYQVNGLTATGQVNIAEKIGDKIIHTFTGNVNQNYTCSPQKTDWEKLLNDENKIIIEFSCADYSRQRVASFTKNVTEISAKTSSIIPTAVPPTKLHLTSNCNVSIGSTFRCEVCNNANDAIPTWEDITSVINSGHTYMFTNRTKTAENWGIQFKFSGARGNGCDTCFLGKLGGTFG